MCGSDVMRNVASDVFFFSLVHSKSHPDLDSRMLIIIVFFILKSLFPVLFLLLFFYFH